MVWSMSTIQLTQTRTKSKTALVYLTEGAEFSFQRGAVCYGYMGYIVHLIWDHSEPVSRDRLTTA